MNTKTKIILVIDDDPFVFELLEDILAEIHYSVIGAMDPLKGIELFRKNHQQIALVILDYSMPKMNGYAVFQELLKIDNNVKVLLCSGFSEEAATEGFEAMPPAGYLKKPYKTQDLIQCVLQLVQ